MESPRWDDLVVVARIARPHGLRGDVILNPESDFPDERFRVGQRYFLLEGARVVSLVVRSAWFQRARPVVAFEGYDNIEAVEGLAGRELRIEAGALAPLPDGMYYHHDPVSCRVVTTTGLEVGVVTKVDGSGDASRLVVDGPAGEVLIPLAVDICTEIDPAARRIVVEPVEGLLDLNEVRSRRERRGRRW